jgi:hypothetical protein
MRPALAEHEMPVNQGSADGARTGIDFIFRIDRETIFPQVIATQVAVNRRRFLPHGCLKPEWHGEYNGRSGLSVSGGLRFVFSSTTLRKWHGRNPFA